MQIKKTERELGIEGHQRVVAVNVQNKRAAASSRSQELLKKACSAFVSYIRHSGTHPLGYGPS